MEAALRSGARITARLATEYNREVFALPGRVDAPQSAGCHELIRKGEGLLVTCFEDVLDGLGEVGAALRSGAETSEDAAPGDMPRPLIVMTPDERLIFEALGDEPAPAEAICESSGLPAEKVAVSLTMLQLKGAVRRHAGELFSRSG